MTDPNVPGGDESVRPPSVPEVPAKTDYTGEHLPPDATGSDADASTTPQPGPSSPPVPPAGGPAASTPGSPPPGPYQGSPGAGAPPPYTPSDQPIADPNATVPIPPANPAPFQSSPPPGATGTLPPGGPGAPFDPTSGYATSPQPGSDGTGAKKGLLIAGLVAVVVALGGALAFLLTQGGDDEIATIDPEPTVTEPVITEPAPVAPTTTVAEQPTTTVAEVITTTTLAEPVGEPIDIDGEFVFLRPVLAPVDVGGEEIIIDSIISSPETFVSTTDDVFAICAALPVDGPVEAELVWSRDSDELARIPLQRYEPGTAGGCFVENAPLPPGTYEVNFIGADSDAVPANVTIGAATRTQEFVNSTDTPVCRIDLVESTASTFELFDADPPVEPGGTFTIELADATHAVRTLGCGADDVPTDEVLFEPSDSPVDLATGVSNVPLTEETFEELFGQIESFDTVLGAGDQAAAVLELANRDFFGRIATTEPSATLCTGWFVGGDLEAAVVWEFNQVEIARQVVNSVDNTIGACIEQQGEIFRTGSYQVYLAGLSTVTDDAASFTAGREQAEVAFLNDTGVELCEVGFSPTLTNYYSTYLLFDDDGNPDTFAADSVFTIEAPVAEVDIRTLDCDGNVVTQVLDVPPTDQVVSVSTGNVV